MLTLKLKNKLKQEFSFLFSAHHGMRGYAMDMDGNGSPDVGLGGV